MLSWHETAAIKGFLIGVSAPLIAALIISAAGILRYWYRWRWGVWAAYAAGAGFWIAFGLPSTNSSTGANQAWRTGLFWGLWSGAIVGSGWVLWVVAAAKPRPERRGFDVKVE